MLARPWANFIRHPRACPEGPSVGFQPVEGLARASTLVPGLQPSDPVDPWALGTSPRVTVVKDARAGFSLIELLVALAVFSLAAVALLNLAGESTRTAATLEERVMAGVIADNRTVEAVAPETPPAPGLSEGVDRLADRDWRWTRLITATADPDILRVEVRVTLGGSATLAEVTAFRSARR